MVFTSASFILFFSLFIIIFYSVPKKIRYIVLFVFNNLFVFLSGWKSFVIFIGLAFLNYCFGLILGKRKQKTLFLSFVSINIIVLSLFKYVIKMMPLGISFYAFSLITYLHGIFSEKIETEKNIIHYLNYTAYFPKFMSGPIERAESFLPKIKNLEKNKISFEDFVVAFEFLLLGFFKKLVIANRLSIFVDKVFDNIPSFGGMTLIIATISFTIQLYCDFSGYCDMAVGISKIIGIDITHNFNHPYLADSLSDFWKRWHISLSSWLRDYIYIPLGGNRKGVFRKYLNLLITMIVSGMWHGSTLTFIIWGGLHGIFSIIESIFVRYLSKLPKWIRQVKTFFVVSFCWIFFRINNASDLLCFFRNLFDKSFWNITQFKISVATLNFSTFNNLTPSILLNINVFICVIICLLICIFEEKKSQRFAFAIQEQKTIVRYLVNYVMIYLLLFTGCFDLTKFIYAAF